MFATTSGPHPMPAGQRLPTGGGGHRVDAASPHQLVLMLFDGFVDSLAQALGALRDGAIETKCRAISRAARIVDEGLKASLDLRSGGTLAATCTSCMPTSACACCRPT